MDRVRLASAGPRSSLRFPLRCSVRSTVLLRSIGRAGHNVIGDTPNRIPYRAGLVDRCTLRTSYG